MKERVIYGVIAFLVFLPFALVGGGYFSYFFLGMGIVGMYELLRMAKITAKFPFVVGVIALYAQLMPEKYMPGFLNVLDLSSVYYLCAIVLLIYTVFKPHKFNFTQASIVMMGAIYIGRGFNLVITTRETSLITLIYFLMAVWMTDIFALLVGRQFGKTKLAPRVSPNKTVEGMIGGVAGAVLSTSIYMIFFDPQIGDWLHVTILTIILSLAGQFGDLIESAYKRHYDVKDSGKLIPGHGGILDRLDSVLFASLALGIWFNIIN